MGSLRTVWYLAVVGLCIFVRGWGRTKPDALAPEYVLVAKIEKAALKEERLKLIGELEALPNKETPFFMLWLTIHDARQYGGWTDRGFDASNVDLPRDVQLLAAVELGVADIDNGDFVQFFGNDTGRFAPEMIEWFDRAGMPECAAILRQATGKFGAEYPRSQTSRQQFLAKYEDANGEGADPFVELDGPFYNGIQGKIAGANSPSFDDAANRWLRATCGITRLSDPPAK